MTGLETAGDPRAGPAQAQNESHVASFGPFVLHDKMRLLERDGVPVKLGSRALDILRLLVSRAGHVVSKNELLAHAWPGLVVEEINLRVHIAELRKALGDGKGGARYVTNIPSRGYCFVATVQHVAAAPLVVALPVQAPPQSAAPVLPHRLERMIGREDVLLDVSQRLLSDRFVTLRGPGGIGKTTVAVALAHDLSAQFDGQVRFLDFGMVKDAALVAGTIAWALGLVVHHSDPTDSIVGHLRNRRMLLVFDSCEHVVEGIAGLVERIHQQAPSVSILVTSRESLLVEGEQIFELAPLEGPPQGARLSASEVLSYPAARLFADRAAAAGHRAELTDDDAEVLAEVCGKLDGIALAIELAAVRVGTHGLREMVSLLDGRLKLEWRGRRTAPPRHQTLGATLDWSYGLIGENERTVLRRLAVFAAPFTLQGAAAVAGEDGDPADRIVESLEQLVAKSLIAVRPEGGVTRYRLLDTTRAYATQKLAESGEATNVAGRHARYVQHALETTAAEAGSGDQASRLRARTLLFSDARAALNWAFANDEGAQLRVPLTGACAKLFVELNLLDEGRLWSSRALAMLDDSTRGSAFELELQAALGHAQMFTAGNSRLAEAALERGLAIAIANGDHLNQYQFLTRLNMFYRRTGNYHRLLPSALEAQKTAQVLGDRAGIGGAKRILGVSYHLIGNQPEALRYLEEGTLDELAASELQPLHFASNRAPQIARPRTLWLLGFPDQAVEATRPITGTAMPPDVVTQCIAICWAASIFVWVRDWSSLQQMVSRLSTLAASHALAPYQAVAAGFRAQSLIARGELKEGIEQLQVALQRLHADRYELYTSAFVAELAHGLAETGQLAEGLSILHEAITRFEPPGASFDGPELLRLRGELEARGGDLKAAEASFAASIALADEQGALSWRLRTEISLARFRLKLRKAKPLDGLAETYARFTEGFETADLKAARELLHGASK